MINSENLLNYAGLGPPEFWGEQVFHSVNYFLPAINFTGAKEELQTTYWAAVREPAGTLERDELKLT